MKSSKKAIKLAKKAKKCDHFLEVIDSDNLFVVMRCTICKKVAIGMDPGHCAGNKSSVYYEKASKP